MDNELIYSYSRAQALKDGVLVDVTAEAKEAGFRVPAAVTAALWQTIEDMPEGEGQSVRGRLHDVLFMARTACSRCLGDDQVPFTVLMLDVEVRRRTLELLCHIGPGDDAEPVLTIGYPSDF